MAQRIGRPPGLVPNGPEIKRLRVGLGLTTAEVAALIGRSPQTIRYAERGRPISDVLASRLAAALGVSMHDITEPEPEATAA